MMRRHVVLARGMLVTGSAGFVTRVFQLQRVWIVTIRTANPFVIHLALNERAVDVHLVQDLAIGVIRLLQQQFVGEVVVIVFSRTVSGLEETTSRMTLKTSIELRLGTGSLQLRQAVTVAAIPEQALGLGDLDVQAGGPVAGFATDIDL